MRRKTRKVNIGNVEIGGGAPVSVQSMTKTRTSDIESTAGQIKRLEAAGCEIIRAAVPDKASAEALKAIKERTNIPLVADIHFNYRLAVNSARSGVDAIRLNPGNIRRREEVEKAAGAALEAGIPVRVGVNSGSLYPESGSAGNMPLLMARSALSYCRMLEDFGLSDLIISVKASGVTSTIAAYRMLAEECDYPFHLGITAAGTSRSATVKSAVCLGVLLEEGLGDTIRVSLTGDPVEEVNAGFEILNSLGLRLPKKPEIISCPTCGRCGVNLLRIVEETENAIRDLELSAKLSGKKIAVMGCAVNGPGEAREADIGIACGRKYATLFKKGKVVKKIEEKEIVKVLTDEIKRIAG